MANTVIITGASDGIGKAMALDFASKGFSIGLLARRKELLDSVAEACRKAGAPQAHCRAGDVADRDSQVRALTELDDALGGARVFVANAGIATFDYPDQDNGPACRKSVMVNVVGAMEGIEFMKSRMAKRGGGRIAGVASIASMRGFPGSGTYCATKAALHTYLQAMSLDVRPLGITVTSINPGFIKTNMTDSNDFPMPFLMAPEKAAGVYVRDVLRGKFLSIAPWQWIPIFWFVKALPEWLFGPIGRMIQKSGMGSTPPAKKYPT